MQDYFYFQKQDLTQTLGNTALFLPQGPKRYRRTIWRQQNNMLLFFTQLGECLANLPHIWIPPDYEKTNPEGYEFYKNYTRGSCHAESFLRVAGFREVPEAKTINPQLWFGLVDGYRNGNYVYSCIHSFITLNTRSMEDVSALPIERIPALYDPCNTSDYLNKFDDTLMMHFGVWIPFSLASKLNTKEFMFARKIKEAFNSTTRTKQMIATIKKAQDAERLLFLFVRNLTKVRNYL